LEPVKCLRRPERTVLVPHKPVASLLDRTDSPHIACSFRHAHNCNGDNCNSAERSIFERLNPTSFRAFGLDPATVNKSNSFASTLQSR
jgi:hypothetical protein